MENEKLKVVFEDDDLLVVEKPAGIVVFPEGNITEKTLADLLIEKFPDLKRTGQAPRYGIIHRLDKDTSGILLVAKNNNTMEYLQGLFKDRKVAKKYTALVEGDVRNKER